MGHGSAMERAITNTAQNRAAGVALPGRRYDPLQIWNEAKKVDPWPDTNPGDDNGTSVSSAYDVLRDLGPRRCQIRFDAAKEQPVPYNVKPVSLADGVVANRWATTVDEIRTALQSGTPVAIGVDWHDAFDVPYQKGTEWWLKTPAQGLGPIRGGHCVCLYAVSDRRQAFKVKNSWGRAYPLVWLPYSTMEALLRSDGEAVIGTDR